MVRKYRQQFEMLMLTEHDVGRLLRVFNSVDMDGSGTVEIAELLTCLKCERTRFSERIFAIFDDDGSGSIDFRELVLSLWNYCSLGQSSLVVFAFDLYDRDNGGSIAADEAVKMLKDVYGKNYASNSQAKQ